MFQIISASQELNGTEKLNPINNDITKKSINSKQSMTYNNCGKQNKSYYV